MLSIVANRSFLLLKLGSSKATTNPLICCVTLSNLTSQANNSSSNGMKPSENTYLKTIGIKLPLVDGKHVEASDIDVLNDVKKSLYIKSDFLTDTDEQSFLDEIEPFVKRLRYEFDHWDNAIHGYRETERSKWSTETSVLLNRIKDLAFRQNPTNCATVKPAPSSWPYNKNEILTHVHVLDLHKDGYIKPHVDSIRFCGNTIAGVCLLSDAVMRLTNEKDKTKYANILLKRRCLYIMKNESRYDYAHEILKNSESYFQGKHVPKDRRISVICRNKPEIVEQ